MWKGRSRKSPRLKGFDYASNGAYFVTIRCHEGQHLFGEIVDGEMRLNDFGNIVWWEWVKSEQMRAEIELDEFVVMPNHFHGIVFIHGDEPTNQSSDPVGTQGLASLQPPQFQRQKRSLSTLISGFKSAVTVQINELRQTPRVPVWQPRFHDRIIRDEDELNRIRQYILENPANWPTDEENQ